ncbi:MAG: SMP-30/gluconolactonase/LRE family protein [Acidobacteriota bacterium]|nr:SMP-30/gluconolactonase/LRE family protein [Acidobacteriota bacterium]
MQARITRVAPLWAVDGGVLLVEGEHLPCDPPPRVTIAEAAAHVVSASPRHIRIVVPAELEGGQVPLRVDAVAGGAVLIDIGTTLATGVHQVDSPAFDRDGNLYATFSGSRENRVPVTLFRVRRDGVREAIRVEIPNPTSVAVGRDGALYVSSRFEGSVYRVDPVTQQLRVFVSGLGSPFGLAFDRAGHLWIGDRHGVIYRADADGVAAPIASIPPSVAACHLAVGPDDSLYVTAPTLSPRDAVYRVTPDGFVDVVMHAHGRPQGLAFDSQGRLYVVEAMAGDAGVWRYDVTGGDIAGERVLAAGALVGLAFDPQGGLVVAAPEALWKLEVPVQPPG